MKTVKDRFLIVIAAFKTIQRIRRKPKDDAVSKAAAHVGGSVEVPIAIEGNSGKRIVPISPVIESMQDGFEPFASALRKPIHSATSVKAAASPTVSRRAIQAPFEHHQVAQWVVSAFTVRKGMDHFKLV